MYTAHMDRYLDIPIGRRCQQLFWIDS